MKNKLLLSSLLVIGCISFANYSGATGLLPSGFQGIVYGAPMNVKIDGATLTFTDIDNPSLVYQTTSGQNGYYYIDLPLGRYSVVVNYPNYQTYAPEGWGIVYLKYSYSTWNVFLIPN